MFVKLHKNVIDASSSFSTKILLLKLFFLKIVLIESKIICEVSPGNETKSNILILIPVSESKNLTIVGNNFKSLWLEASEYINKCAFF